MKKVTCIRRGKIEYVNDADGIAVLISARELVVYYMETRSYDIYKISSTMAVVSLDGILYVSNAYNQFFAIDLKSKEMRKLPKGKIRSNLEDFIVNRNYIVCHDLDRMEVFNVQTNRWKYLKNRKTSVDIFNPTPFNRTILNYDETHFLLKIDGWKDPDQYVVLDYETCCDWDMGTPGKILTDYKAYEIYYDMESQMFIAKPNGCQTLDVLDKNLNVIRSIRTGGYTVHIMDRHPKKKGHFIINFVDFDEEGTDIGKCYIYNIIDNKFKKIDEDYWCNDVNVSYRYGLYFKTVYANETCNTTVYEWDEETQKDEEISAIMP